MFSITLKRSAATLGVVAGLLAAAGPASAQIVDGPVLAKAGPQPEADGYLATDPSSEVDNQIRLAIGGAEAAGFVKAPAKTWTDGNNQPADFGSYRQGATLGTQVPSAAFRGEVIGLEPTVKAPASPTSDVFTSVSNAAPLHGDATTLSFSVIVR